MSSAIPFRLVSTSDTALFGQNQPQVELCMQEVLKEHESCTCSMMAMLRHIEYFTVNFSGVQISVLCTLSYGIAYTCVDVRLYTT